MQDGDGLDIILADDRLSHCLRYYATQSDNILVNDHLPQFFMMDDMAGNATAPGSVGHTDDEDGDPGDAIITRSAVGSDGGASGA